VGLGLWLLASVLPACGSNGSGSASVHDGGAAGSDGGTADDVHGSGGASDGAGGAGGAGGAAAPRAPLVINEVMPSNSETVADDFGGYPDWIELYNTTDADVDLGGYFVSDDLDDPEKFPLAPGVTIGAKGYLLLWADGNTAQGDSHLPFKLSKDAEAALLSGPDGTLLDSLEFEAAQPDYSLARFPNGVGDFAWCASASPGDPNPDECPSGSGDPGADGGGSAGTGSN
jgi:hypothetical protein